MAQLIPCPDCKKQLQVPDELLGKLVQCPECRQTFTARLPEDVIPSTGTTTSPSPPPAPWQSDDSKPPPKKRRRDDDDKEDDDRDRERGRHPIKRNFMPHKGEMILIFGLMSLILPAFSVIFGLMAWIMGGSDLREMREGRMDPNGEGMTQAGRIMGMVSVGLHLFWYPRLLRLLWLYFRDHNCRRGRGTVKSAAAASVKCWDMPT
ncbi:MAG: hypothetical protein EXS16_06090 [Gemmataceae bacterium]|nr:hypothetical protein [Gemmataceae bacterium]